MTEALGALCASVLSPGDVVGLRGELGAGKTTFVRGLARALGYDGRVGSPSYALCNHYEGLGGRSLDHFDAYFADKERAFLAEGGAEILGGEGISVVEWAERIEDALPTDWLEFRFEAGPSEADRIVTVRGHGERGAVLARALEAAASLCCGGSAFVAPPEVANA